MHTVEIQDKLAEYTRIIQGITALLDDMHLSDTDGGHIYSPMRFLVLESLLFEIAQGLEKLYEALEAKG